MKVEDAIAWLKLLPENAEVDVIVRPPSDDLFAPMTAAERAREYRRRKRDTITKKRDDRDGGVRGGVSLGSEKQAEKKEENGSTCQVDLGATVTKNVTLRDGRKMRWRRVPENWAPNEAHRALAASRNVTLELEVAKFRDHEFASAKSDADATFRNWLRQARPVTNSVTRFTTPTAATVLAERARRIAAGEKP